jgi:N-acetylglucosamine kinase-like BadF-type ATPase
MAKFIIGIDGGRSKTAGVICDMDGRVLTTARTESAAIAGKPHNRAIELLDCLIDELSRKAHVPRSDVIHFGLGLNGVDYSDEAPRQHALLCEALRIAPPRLTLVNDGVIALWGVSLEPRLALVQHGSGLVAVHRDEPGRETIFDSLDVGGIFDIRREALRTTARMLDGRLDRTLLADRMVEYFQTSDDRFAECVHREEASRDLFFSLAPIVFRAWADGDRVAEELVDRAVDDYVLAALAMAKQLRPGAFDVAFGGGVIRSGGAQLLARIADRLAVKCPQARVVPVALTPERGALVMAAHRLHLETAEIFDQLRDQPGAMAARLSGPAT